MMYFSTFSRVNLILHQVQWSVWCVFSISWQDLFCNELFYCHVVFGIVWFFLFWLTIFTVIKQEENVSQQLDNEQFLSFSWECAYFGEGGGGGGEGHACVLLCVLGFCHIGATFKHRHLKFKTHRLKSEHFYLDRTKLCKCLAFMPFTKQNTDQQTDRFFLQENGKVLWTYLETFCRSHRDRVLVSSSSKGNC